MSDLGPPEGFLAPLPGYLDWPLPPREGDAERRRARVAEGWCPHEPHGRLQRVGEFPADETWPEAALCPDCGVGWAAGAGGLTVRLRPAPLAG